jgi:hypothetical protein
MRNGLVCAARARLSSGRALLVETPSLLVVALARMCLASAVLACDNRRMAIEDFGYAKGSRRTRHAPSRVRTMLRGLQTALQTEHGGSHGYVVLGGQRLSGSELIPQIEEALAEWRKLDDLLAQASVQRKRIASRISAFVEFYVGVHGQFLLINRKKRKKLTAVQRVLFTGKLRETRRLRGTLGKRQKQRLKAQAEGLTVTIGGPAPRQPRGKA